MRRFVARQGEYVVRLGSDEREVLATVASDVARMLGAAPFDAAPEPAAGRAGAGDEPPAGSGRPTSERAADPHGAWPWSQAVDPPEDPAVRRLLPDGSLDPEQAAEFRRFTEGDLRERKIAGLRTWWAALTTPGGRQGDAVAVTEAEAPAVAAAMTDVRLVLAERLGVRTDDDGDRLYAELAQDPAEDRAAQVRHAFVGVYAVLSELQESLVGAMLTAARARGTSHRRGGGTPGAAG
ncbi:DUF2017 family protein [Cellulomonas sp. DKR-3]|uniref:DUF2017 family protein n=1 Tax=Cellulomonas fulva TaxID=2835530 RepID=A0ABS5U2H7_9CELL|nr:DUF2017 family protein [Cellulomonas fulva]MBT0995611.1 DUF2017 family protein [Cellulomonas fulva]